MVAPIPSGDTTQWDIEEWVWEQGEYLPSGSHAAVLAFLSSKAFYEKDNPEDGEIGQVMRQYSYTDAIMRATAIKSRTTLRSILNDLQDLAYIQREERPVSRLYGQQPHLIYVLWEMDELRSQIRNGKPLPPALRIRPAARQRRSKPDLQVVRMTQSINS